MAVFDDTAAFPDKLKLYAHSVEWPGNVPVARKAAAENIVLEEQEPLRVECQHFLDSIQNRSTPYTDGEEGVRVLKVLNACQEALEEGGAIVLDPNPNDKEATHFVHKSAVVDEGVEIGEGAKIWHFSHILTESKIGINANIGQNVVIGPRVSVGDGCKIQNNVSVYEGVTLEDNVFCGPSMVFTNVFNPRCHIRRMKELRKTLVRKGATIGANATIICGNTIGEYAFIGAGAVVTEDVPPHGMYLGNPAVLKGWMCSCGVRLFDDLTCPECGVAYQKGKMGLTRIQGERNSIS